MTRTITLKLDDEQFMFLFAMAASYVANRTPVENSPTADVDVMQNLHAACRRVASDEEKHVVDRQVEKARSIFQTDSADLDLAKTGIKGLAEKMQQE